MTNYKGKNTQLELLDKHIATGTETAYQTTISCNYLKYKSVELHFDLDCTASFVLKFAVNEVESGTLYYKDGWSSVGGVLAVQTYDTTEGLLLLAGSSKLAGKFTVNVNNLSQGTGTYERTDTGTQTSEQGGWFINSDLTGTITEMKITVSTSSWKADSQISVYGVKR